MSVVNLNESQLDDVVGGASYFKIKKCADGSLEVRKFSGEGDLESLKKIANGGSVSSLKVSVSDQRSTVKANKAEGYLAMLAKRKDTAFEFVDKF
jgi:hypothetical protein